MNNLKKTNKNSHTDVEKKNGHRYTVESFSTVVSTKIEKN